MTATATKRPPDVMVWFGPRLMVWGLNVVGMVSVPLVSNVCRANGARPANARPVEPASRPERDKFKAFSGKPLISMVTSASDRLVMLNTSVTLTTATALPVEGGAVARTTASPPSRN